MAPQRFRKRGFHLALTCPAYGATGTANGGAALKGSPGPGGKGGAPADSGGCPDMGRGGGAKRFGGGRGGAQFRDPAERGGCGATGPTAAWCLSPATPLCRAAPRCVTSAGAALGLGGDGRSPERRGSPELPMRFS